MLANKGQRNFFEFLIHILVHFEKPAFEKTLLLMSYYTHGTVQTARWPRKRFVDRTF